MRYLIVHSFGVGYRLRAAGSTLYIGAHQKAEQSHSQPCRA